MPVFPPPPSGVAGGGSVAWFDEGTAIGTGTAFNLVGGGATATFSSGTAIITIQGTASIGYMIDGGTAVPGTGIVGWVEVPFGCTITAARAFADATGSAVVDVWKDTYANYPPTDADSITAAAPITVAGATKSEDATLTGWTTALAAGDVLYFNLDSVSTIKKLLVSLRVRKNP